MILGNDKALWLLFTVPVILVPVYVWCFWRKAQVQKIFASSEMLKRINLSVSYKKQLFKAFLLLVAFTSIVIALTEPKWNPKPREVKRRGRDIVILLDTSRSMLAEDIKPNRLERSKIAINDLMEALRGDRIAIVTFAGNSTIKCPLTQDYSFVRMTLADISTESTSVGGTKVGDAIRKAINEVFDKANKEYKDIILITDGEEHESQDTLPVQAAEKAAENGIRIITIGIGDEEQGGRIPIIGPDGQKLFLKYKGEEVWSKVKSRILREMVAANKKGRYLPVKPGTNFDLGQIYMDFIESAQKRQLESFMMMKYDERFQVFLVLGLILIICEIFISERRKN